MRKRVRVPKPARVEDAYGKMLLMVDCEPLEDHVQGGEGLMPGEWLHDYDPKQDIIFTWSYEGIKL